MVEVNPSKFKVKTKSGQSKIEAQRRYLSLVAKGLDSNTAIDLVGRNRKMLYHWRKDENFARMEAEAQASFSVPAGITEEEFNNQVLETSQLAITQLGLILQSNSTTDAMKLGASKAMLEFLDKTRNTTNETKLVNNHLAEASQNQEPKKVDGVTELIDLSDFDGVS